MASRGERRWSRRLAAVGLVVSLAPTAARAQGSLFERLNLDRLQLTALGGSIGATEPSQLEPTELYSLYSDYGEISPRWRVVFSITYWRSKYEDDVVQRFIDSLRLVIDDPSGDDTVRPTEVTVSDIVVGGGLRWSPRRSSVLRPYLGAGLNAHVINSEGPLIDGTFVERALDNITAGISGVAGIDIFPVRQLSIDLQASFDLVTGTRFSSLRIGGSYHFGPRRDGEIE